MSEMAESGDRVIAVLTGDLVKSRGMTADQLAIVRARLSDAVDKISEWSAGLVIGGPQFFRGDSWQLALAHPGYCLRVAMALRAALIGMDVKADTRIGIGIGTTERIHPQQISLSVGEAFLLSGEALDTIGRARLCVGLGAVDQRRLPLFGPLVSTSDVIVSRMKPAQARAAWLGLAVPTPAGNEIARALGIKPQSASGALRAVGFDALIAAAESVEALRWRQPDQADFEK